MVEWTRLFRRCGVAAALFAALTLFYAPFAAAETPDETYKALGLSKSASPKELYEALTKRYHDEAQGAGKAGGRRRPVLGRSAELRLGLAWTWATVVLTERIISLTTTVAGQISC